MNIIGLALIFLTAAFPALQLTPLLDAGNAAGLLSQYLGMAALVLMAWTQILAARIKGFESLFGGLDQMYVLHKWSGITAMLAMLVHSSVDADVAGSVGGLFSRLAEGLGEVSLYGLLLLSALSVATFIPYHLWKWSHKAMGALFALGALHFIGVAKPFAMTDPAGWYTGAFCAAGLLAYAWTLLPDRFRPSSRYSISGIEDTGGATAITLRAHGRALKPAAGQFGLVRFTGSGMSEPHPYTFSGIEPDGQLRVTIKPLGDFTRNIRSALEVGQDVRVQGPFGRFRLATRKPQVWIAGGIGITPFLTWARALPSDAPTVDLFYCVKSQAEAPHLQEIKQLAGNKPNLNLHLIVSCENQRLTADMISDVMGDALKNTKVSFCGPLPMRASLQKDLRAYGVSRRQFHFENFEFRTGLGMQWLLDKIIRPTIRTVFEKIQAQTLLVSR
jgi:predicted ferric reductase